MPLQQYEQIKLKDEIQGTLGDREAIDRMQNRTPGKDEVAQYILEEVVQAGRWPEQMTQLAEETGYSRQHCANVIKDYYEPVEGDEIESVDPSQHKSPMSASPNDHKPAPTSSESDTETSSSSGTETVFIQINDHVEEVEISIPEGLTEPRAAYVRGYIEGARNR